MSNRYQNRLEFRMRDDQYAVVTLLTYIQGSGRAAYGWRNKLLEQVFETYFKSRGLTVKKVMKPAVNQHFGKDPATMTISEIDLEISKHRQKLIKGGEVTTEELNRGLYLVRFQQNRKSTKVKKPPKPKVVKQTAQEAMKVMADMGIKFD